MHHKNHPYNLQNFQKDNYHPAYWKQTSSIINASAVSREMGREESYSTRMRKELNNNRFRGQNGLKRVQVQVNDALFFNK